MSSNQAQILTSLLSTKADKLYRLQDIGTASSWDYSLPTISHKNFTDRSTFSDDRSFFGILKKSVNNGLPYQILQDAGAFKKDNDLVLFGGCLLDIIYKRQQLIKDFDVRLIGEEYMNDEFKCIAKAKEFVASIFATLLEENEKIDQQLDQAKEEGRRTYVNKCDIQEVTVSRSRSTVSVHVPDFGEYNACVFQLTFAPLTNVEDMFSSCQPHCTRLAILNGEVVLDHTARYCIESGIVVLDPAGLVNFYCNEVEDETEQARRVTSGHTIAGQIQRYINYYSNKNFEIVMPHLDMEKVPRRNLEYDVCEVLALPSMTIVYRDVDKKQIVTTSLKLCKDLESKVPSNGLIGAYDSTPAPNVGVAIHHNIRCLVNGVYNSFKFVAKGEKWDDVFSFVPNLTERMVIRKSYDTVTSEFDDGNFPIDKISGYFSATPPHEVVEKLVTQPLRETCEGRLPKRFAIEKNDLKELAEKEILSLVNKLGNLRKTLEEKGLDNLVVTFPENVSSTEDVSIAIYGSAGGV